MRPLSFHMARLTHAGKVTEEVCLFRVCKFPEWTYVMDGYGCSNVPEANHAGTAITQYRQHTGFVPPPAPVCLNASHIQRRLNTAPSLGNKLIGARPIAEAAHLIASWMLSRFVGRSFKFFIAIRASVFNVIDEAPTLGWANLSFVWTRKAKAILVPYGMRAIVHAVRGGPPAVTRLTAKPRIGHAIVRYRILDTALNAVLGWHVAKITNKRYHGGSMSIAIACDIEGYDLDLCELDPDYFAAGKKRLEQHQSQPRMFDPEPRKVDQQLTIGTE